MFNLTGQPYMILAVDNPAYDAPYQGQAEPLFELFNFDITIIDSYFQGLTEQAYILTSANLDSLSLSTALLLGAAFGQESIIYFDTSKTWFLVDVRTKDILATADSLTIHTAKPDGDYSKLNGIYFQINF